MGILKGNIRDFLFNASSDINMCLEMAIKSIRNEWKENKYILMFKQGDNKRVYKNRRRAFTKLKYTFTNLKKSRIAEKKNAFIEVKIRCSTVYKDILLIFYKKYLCTIQGIIP